MVGVTAQLRLLYRDSAFRATRRGEKPLRLKARAFRLPFMFPTHCAHGIRRKLRFLCTLCALCGKNVQLRLALLTKKS
ncbi:MAG: hypothetical protein WAV60_18410, partial [Anaerolineae bacterium]